MASIFSAIANIGGNVAAGAEQKRLRDEERARQAAADARANRALDIQQSEADSLNQERLFSQHEQQQKDLEQDQALPALQAELHRLRPGIDVSGLSYEAIQSELNRATQEHDVQLAHQYQLRSEQLSLYRQQEQIATSNFNSSYRMWTQALSDLKSDQRFKMQAAMRGITDPNSPGYTAMAAAYIRDNNPAHMDLYGQYIQSYRDMQGVNAQLSHLGAASALPPMSQRSIAARAPFAALDPATQQQVAAAAQAAIAAGKPVDADGLRARGVPVQLPPDATQSGGVAAAPQPSAMDLYMKGDIGGAINAALPFTKSLSNPAAPNNPGAMGMFTQPSGFPEPPAPTVTMPPVTVNAPAGPFDAAGGAGRTWSTNQNLPYTSTPLFGAPPQTPPATLPTSGGEIPVPLGMPSPQAVSAPTAATVGAPTAANVGAPNAQPARPLFSQPVGVQPSPAVIAQGGNATGPAAAADQSGMQRRSALGAPAPDMMGAPFDARTVGLNQLRTALTAPDAERIARGLLDSGATYDVVTSSIPPMFRSLVAAKLPKRIPSLFSTP